MERKGTEMRIGFGTKGLLMAVLALDIKITQVGRKKWPVTIASRHDGRLRKDSTPQVKIFPYNINMTLQLLVRISDASALAPQNYCMHL